MNIFRFPDDEKKVEDAWKEDRKKPDFETARKIASLLRPDQGKDVLLAFLDEVEKCIS